MDQKLPFDMAALQVFGKVAECRSLTKAAELLGMPKSTVSRQINKLEGDLGIKLLRKNTHQISVTDIGEKIYQHGLSILSEANEIRAIAEGSKQEPIGLLKVAIPLFVGIDFASRAGSRFLQRYPKSQLDIRLVDNMVHPIKDGFDVALGVGPLQDSTLLARKLFTLDSFLCASPDFIAQLDSTPTLPNQLNKLPFIDSGFYSRSRKLVLTKGNKSAELSPPVRAQANNFQVIKQYILQGLGIGIMPNRIICAEELKQGTLVPLLPEWQLETVDVYMIYPFQLSFSNLISTFYDIAVEIIEENTAVSNQHVKL